MTLREAIDVLLAGYGDDCPSYGDDWLGALLVLGAHDLVDLDRHRSDLESRWPRAAPVNHWLFEEYANNVRVSLAAFPTMSGMPLRRRETP